MEEISNWIKQNKPVAFIIVISSIVIISLGALFLVKKPPSPVLEEFETVLEDLSSESSVVNNPIYADIKGAVIRPGMYQISENMRLLDVVELAGGFGAEADQNQVNFSQLVTDQMIIYVPIIGEALEQLPTTSGQLREEEASAKVNLNTADLSVLQQLSGIGEKKALAIIAYREEKGSFKSIDELKEVNGIGDKTFETIKAEIEI